MVCTRSTKIPSSIFVNQVSNKLGGNFTMSSRVLCRCVFVRGLTELFGNCGCRGQEQ